MDISLATLGVPREEILKQISTFKDYQDFVSVGLEVRQFRDHSAWILGCLAIGIEKKYGFNTVGTFAKEIGVQVGSLEAYRWTVSCYLKDDPEFLPSEMISFGVLRSVAKLPAEQRREIIEDAEQNGMTVERARVEAKKKRGISVPVKPKFQLSHCEIHNKWSIVPGDLSQWERHHE